MDSGFPWWILLVVVVFGIFTYLMLMLFVPEWVGITGKTALENEKSHREGSEAIEPPPKGRMRTMPGSQPPSAPHSQADMTNVASQAPTPNSPPTLTLVKKSDPADSQE